MNVNNKIGWCSATWSPVTGCTPISEGCSRCWAKRMAETRLRGRCGYDAKEPFRVTFHPNRLYEPYKLNKPSKIFVTSMGDLFHEKVSLSWFWDIWREMINCSWHIFFLLTKRPENMQQILGRRKIPAHIWLGVTAENQARADERIPILLSIRATVHFVSVEPMLGPVDLTKYLDSIRWPDQRLNWVIVGPETGPHKRPCKPEWIEDLYHQCKTASMPFFDKRKDYITRERP